MSLTLWIDEEAQLTIEFGQTFSALKAIGKLVEVASVKGNWLDDWPYLSCVMDACMEQNDMGQPWLDELTEEAKRYKRLHGDSLSEEAAGILDAIIAGPEDGTLAPEEEAEMADLDAANAYGHEPREIAQPAPEDPLGA